MAIQPNRIALQSREVMARTRAGVQNAQSAELASGIELCEPLGNRRRNAVEMTCVEEFRPVPQLRHAIAPRSRLASPLAQEIDVTLSGEIETMSVSADERAGRSGQLGFTERAPQQAMAAPRLGRRHDAAPPARRTGNRS